MLSIYSYELSKVETLDCYLLFPYLFCLLPLWLQIVLVYFKAKLLGELESRKSHHYFYLFFHILLDTRTLISLKILHSVILKFLLNLIPFDTSIFCVKYFKISLKLASEIFERTIYLFLTVLIVT